MEKINTLNNEQYFYLTEIVGAKVFLHGKKIGKLADIIVVEKKQVPEVTHFYISRPFGNPALVVPRSNVISISGKEVHIEIDALDKYVRELTPEEILLKDYVLDKKVLDFEDHEVEVVYDIKITKQNDNFYVSDVDLSRYGLLRRIGLRKLADFIYNLADKIKEQTISWAYIQPLPTNLTSFRGNVKLKILKEKLAEMHPVDLADILEELDPEQRVAIFDGLDTEQASDTLEETEPNVTRDLVFALGKEKVAQLINDMTPGQAANVLSVLPTSEANRITPLLDKDIEAKIKKIMDSQEENILNFVTKYFFRYAPTKKVGEVLAEYRKLANENDVIMYIYVVDENDVLLGVIDLKELLVSQDEQQLKDIMTEDVIALDPDSTLKEASDLFERYGFRAIPVTDDNDKIIGVIPYKDIMDLKHRFIE
ncbi:MAG TPA: CBS domain-containing protein [Candidatus Kapabacteria bacterium]|nr:CBS domain-containing protein [Candidatus Kapabacteria bacterium]